ncbi:MAG: hypothetical protein ACRC1T_05450 [Clostridium chrysemydis]|uniref:hypothetical protein n=1 Tax=Clostridium chrysemydis TaxID=2665504 RepID=UPI003F3A9E72
MKMIYNGGDMLLKGSRIQREQEKNEMKELGFKIYNPLEDKEINDKSAQTEESNNKLAEKIVRKDTKGIIDSDIIVLEPLSHAIGSNIEMGQIKGMKDMAKMIMNIYKNTEYIDDALDEIVELCTRTINKPVFTHYEDVRRTDIPECGDRRSWGINQYCYGVCLDLTKGKGLYEWEEILEELKKQ